MSECAADYDCYLGGLGMRCVLPQGICATRDAGFDAPDVATDAATDAATDVTMDVAMDVTMDVAMDVTIDAATSVDTGTMTDASSTSDATDVRTTPSSDGEFDLRDALPPPPPIDAISTPPFDSRQVMIAGSPTDSHACWVTERDDVWCAGAATNSRFGALVDSDAGVDGGANISPPRLTTLGPARDVSTGPGFTCVLRPSGEVACVGENGVSQLGVAGGSRSAPVTLSFAEPVVQIVSADFRTYARTASGRLYRWGSWSSALFGRVTIATPQEVTELGAIAEVSAGASTVCVVTATGSAHCEGLQGLGAPRPMGESVERFVQVRTSAATNPPIADVTSITCGSRTCCAVLRDRTVSCWGEGAAGSLGDGTMVGRLYAAPVPSLTDVRALGAIRWITTGAVGAVRPDTVCAVVGAERGLQCWGSRSPSTVRPSPEAFGGLTGVRVLRGGLYGMIVVDGRGTSYAWGSNNNGCLGLPIRPPPPSGHEYTLPAFVEFR